GVLLGGFRFQSRLFGSGSWLTFLMRDGIFCLKCGGWKRAIFYLSYLNLNLKHCGVKPRRMTLYVGFMSYEVLDDKSQSEFIVKAFGEKGENMKGELVRANKALGSKQAEIVDAFSWGETHAD
ncbi:hypothetical protein M1N93_02975, partial [Dehalococcoidia bacterium]|nr:hypothetical protein [Dehalococcoidia bacterium]